MIERMVTRMLVWLFGGVFALLGLGIPLLVSMDNEGTAFFWVLAGLVAAIVSWIAGTFYYWGRDVAQQARTEIPFVKGILVIAGCTFALIVELIKRLKTGSW